MRARIACNHLKLTNWSNFLPPQLVVSTGFSDYDRLWLQMCPIYNVFLERPQFLERPLLPPIPDATPRF